MYPCKVIKGKNFESCLENLAKSYGLSYFLSKPSDSLILRTNSSTIKKKKGKGKALAMNTVRNASLVKEIKKELKFNETQHQKP